MPTRTQELWLFDKVTLEKQVFGEFENNFSASLVLDRNRDSTKVIVYNYNTNVVLPNTICYMPTLNLWWIVASDRATRHANGMYEHELQLLGAIEIFAHRDMINCGFNKDRYTLGTFLTRLASFIDFELPISFDYTYYDQNKKIEYVKTFENFTPLSAIKEMLNGINAEPKLHFTIAGNVLTSAIISIIPKTGINNTPIDIDDFDDEREIKTIDRNSYGSSVISNAKNCVSSKAIRYPASGSCLLESGGGELTYENAYLKLPTNADYVEKLILYFFNCEVHYTFKDDNENTITVGSYPDYLYGCLTDETKNDIVEYLKQYIENYASGSGISCVEALEDLEHYKNEIYRYLEERAGAWLFLNGEDKYAFRSVEDISAIRKVAFGDRNFYDTYDHPKYCMYWEQGTNKIKNFGWFGEANNPNGTEKGLIREPFANEDLEAPNNSQIVFESNYIGIYSQIQQNSTGFTRKAMRYVVYYVPQTDTKIKVKNSNVGNDTNIYNQTGKLVSSVALSRLLNAYSNEVSSEEITRYKTYKSFENVPKIGSVVNNNGTNYIINNLSLDFHELEDDYYINATITLTKRVACKSTLISGNKNIRDYECPQLSNVCREQMYIDHYELTYDKTDNAKNISVYNNNIFDILEFEPKGCDISSMSFIKIKNSNYNGIYFKKSCSVVVMPKQLITIVDFEDNNIIGYNSVHSAIPVFNALDFFNTDLMYCVPISYVDEKGELDDISISLITKHKYETCVRDYVSDEGYAEEKFNYMEYSPIIPQEMYESATLQPNKVDMQLINYKKDGLEIPKFEFVIELANSNDVIIGNGIFDNASCGKDEVLVYYYREVNKIINEDNVDTNASDSVSIVGESVTVSNACVLSTQTITESGNTFVKLNVNFYRSQIINILTGASVTIVNQDDLSNKNIAIFVARVSKTKIVDEKMIFGLNNVKEGTTTETIFWLNHWKLK